MTRGPALGPAGPEAGSTCAATGRQPVDFLFVLDGSGSMNDANKWASVRPALTSLFQQMASAADDGVAAGLIVFADSKDPTEGMGPYPSSADVPLGFVDARQLSSLDQRLAGDASGSTPTHAVLEGGYGELAGFGAPAPLERGGKKVLVLITDGIPSDDCATLPLIGDYASNPCVILAGNERAHGGIETFVVGVGDPSSAGFFDDGLDDASGGDLAAAGRTAGTSCTTSDTSSESGPCYFAIETSQSSTAAALEQAFGAALDAIRGQAESCVVPGDAERTATRRMVRQRVRRSVRRSVAKVVAVAAWLALGAVVTPGCGARAPGALEGDETDDASAASGDGGAGGGALRDGRWGVAGRPARGRRVRHLRRAGAAPAGVPPLRGGRVGQHEAGEQVGGDRAGPRLASSRRCRPPRIPGPPRG